MYMYTKIHQMLYRIRLNIEFPVEILCSQPTVRHEWGGSGKRCSVVRVAHCTLLLIYVRRLRRMVLVISTASRLLDWLEVRLALAFSESAYFKGGSFLRLLFTLHCLLGLRRRLRVRPLWSPGGARNSTVLPEFTSEIASCFPWKMQYYCHQTLFISSGIANDFNLPHGKS